MWMKREAWRDRDFRSQPAVVFDLEASGLDPRRDRILSIGAVRIEDLAIPLGRQYDRVLRTPGPLGLASRLFHGLTRADLDRGTAPGDALEGLLDFAGDAVWLAFHAGFDRALLVRALKTHLGRRWGGAVLDLAVLAPMLFPDRAGPHAGLDEWAAAFGLVAPARHAAVVDAMLTAELALVALRRAQRRGLRTWGELESAARDWRAGRMGTGGPVF
ncbi:DNA polymerase III epsilon subunit OS=Castellaniella defragrans (strain DSM / CCUG 39792 / 65Phen)OX=1437824 GN=BN940_03816 PE=4 SV=1 [Castellaniella denitrificans]